jgi:radical SAM superfamily enzyme YgiQ (UPF0313 family)
MINVALINPPFKETVLRDNYCSHTSKGKYIWPQVDLLYISGSLAEAKINFSVYDFIAEENTSELLMKLTEQSPSHVISLTGAVSFQEDMIFLEGLKNKFNSKIIVCGNVAAFEPLRFLNQFNFVDAILHNYFDKEIVQYINGLEVTTKSISFRKERNVSIGKINYISHGEKILAAVPAIEKFPLKFYSTPLSLRKPIASVVTSFGCPYGCSFCVASELNLYHREISNLRSELEHYEKNGVREIFFMDSTFNSSSRRLKELCKLLSEFDFTWSCNIHAGNMDHEGLSLLKKSGCHTIQIGVETFNEKTLKTYAPTKNIEKMKIVFNSAREVGLRTLGYFILGLPSESSKEVRRTIDFAIDLDPDFASFSTLAADYGTPMYRELFPLENQTAKLRSYDNSGLPQNVNINLSQSQRNKMIKEAYFRFYFRPKYLLRLVFDVKNLKNYLTNGLYLIRKIFYSKFFS